MRRPFRIGLTGGIGAGKSEAARRFEERGALVIDADVLAREAVATGSARLDEVARRWPQAIDAHGALDRAALSRIVFADEAARAALNRIVHPHVRRLGEAREGAARAGQPVVHVIPLLFEGDFWRRCDATVLVVAPIEARIARVLARDVTTRDAVLARMAAQIDPEQARRRATFVIENDGERATLLERSDAVYDALLAAQCEWKRAGLDQRDRLVGDA